MSILTSDYRLQVKAEASFADPDTDFSSGATFLPLLGAGATLRPTKRLEDIDSNVAHPHPYRVAMGRDNTGQINSQIDRDTRRIMFDLGFGGFASANGGAPSRSTSYGAIKRKGSVSGEFFTGIKAQTFGIAAAAGGIVTPTLDVVAATEAKTTAPTIALPSTLRTPYRFATGVVVINGALASSFNSVNLNVANNLLVGPHRTSSLQISYLEYGKQDITGDVTVLFDAETYNDLVRGTQTGTIIIILGEAYATSTADAWNTSDYFEDGEDCLRYDGSSYTIESAAITSGALTNTNDAGNILVQNPVLIKLNSCEFPDAPENPGNGGVVQQTLQFQITAPTSTSTIPVEVFFDAVSAS